jgi:hypothetical protein
VKTLSVRQPWAWLLVQGIKTVENRTWRTNYRGPLLIHAGGRLDLDWREEIDRLAHPRWRVFWRPNAYWREVLERLADCPVEDEAAFPRGGSVGSVTLGDIVTASDDPWFTGPFGWVVQEARPLVYHACRGQLGLFEMAYPSCGG